MSWRTVLFGRRLANEEDAGRRVGTSLGLSTFGLAALASSAYGPEATLTVLIPAGSFGLSFLVPLTGAVVALLLLVYFSYHQAIAADPAGGGSYVLARQNLGARGGVLAAAALMIDYTLNAAVGISASVGALVSAAPGLQPYTLPLCLGILALLTVANLRGLREAGVLWVLPMIGFLVSLLGVIVAGVVKTMLAEGTPVPVVAPPSLQAAVPAVGAWLLIKAFASGCTAMTGIEAVSDGVPAFREPVVRTARRTLALIVVLLIALIVGVAFLARSYGIGATVPGEPGYQSILSQVTAAVVGKGVTYYVTIAAIIAVLSLSANTSFADFPRLCRVIALHGYLPHNFTTRGRRLVFTSGIMLLSGTAALLLIGFRGITDHLIPLFAVGALLSFTISQAALVVHWRKSSGPGRAWRMALSAIGCIGTGATVLIILFSRFQDGAWLTIVVVPALVATMSGIRRHYHRVTTDVLSRSPLEVAGLTDPVVLVPIKQWDRRTQKALRFALTLSPQVRAVHVNCDDEPAELERNWDDWVAAPARAAGKPAPALEVVPSPYRRVIDPLVDYVVKVERRERNRQIAVVVSQLVAPKRRHRLFHNQRGNALVEALTRNGDERIVVVTVPWYVHGTNAQEGST